MGISIHRVSKEVLDIFEIRNITKPIQGYKPRYKYNYESSKWVRIY